MEMRDRLIELINQAKDKTPCSYNTDIDCEGIVCSACENGSIADHLLANGVIVPPCKVGDTVFYIDTCETAEDFGKKFVSFSQVKRISVDYEYVVLADHTIVLWGGVFLTKEEAEKALKEREGNG